MRYRHKLLIGIIVAVVMAAVAYLLPFPTRFTFQEPAMQITIPQSTDSGDAISDDRAGTSDNDDYDQTPVTLEITGWLLHRLLGNGQLHATITVRGDGGTVLRTIRLEDTSGSTTNSSRVVDDLLITYYFSPTGVRIESPGRSIMEGSIGTLVFDPNDRALMLQVDAIEGGGPMEVYVAPASTLQQAKEVEKTIRHRYNFCFLSELCTD